MSKTTKEAIERTKRYLDTAKPRHVQYGLEMEMGTLGLDIMQIRKNVNRCLLHKNNPDKYEVIMEDIEDALNRLDGIRKLVTDYQNIYIR